MHLLPVAIELRGLHFHCHLCGAAAHLTLPPGSEDLERFVTDPAYRWLGSHLDPHLHAVDLAINGQPMTRPVT